MDAEPGGILYLQEFFSDSVNEMTFRIMFDWVVMTNDNKTRIRSGRMVSCLGMG